MQKNYIKILLILFTIIPIFLLSLTYFSFDISTNTSIKDNSYLLVNPAKISEISPNWDFINNSDLEDFMDTNMENHLIKYKIPGVIVSVVKNDTLLYSKGFGFADIYQNKTIQANQTIFRMCSVSKLLTWTAVMQLWEAKMIDLDADINSYLTSFKIPTRPSKPITMKHLMSHTAGFEDLIIRMQAQTPEKLIELENFCKKNIPFCIFPPGEIFAYSNYGVTLAGYLIQEISGMPFNEYITKNIFNPLGMNYSTFYQPLPINLSKNLSVGYTGMNADGKYESGNFLYFNVGPAAGMSSTASDMANFMIAHLLDNNSTNPRILSPSTTKLMQSHLHSMDPRVNGFAYGWMEMTSNGHRLIFHHGSSSSFNTILVLSRELNFGLFLSYNHYNGQYARWDMLNAFMNKYFPASTNTSTHQPLENYKERIDLFTGIYRDPRFPYSSCMKVLGLTESIPYNTYPVTKTNDNSYLVVFDTLFIEVEPFVFYPIYANGTIIEGDFYLIFLENYGTDKNSYFVTSQGYLIQKLEWIEQPLTHWIIIIFSLITMLFYTFGFLGFSLYKKIHKIRNKLSRKICLSLDDHSTVNWIFKQNTLIINGFITIISLLFIGFTLSLLIVNQIFIEISWGISISLITYLIFSLPIIAISLICIFFLYLGISLKMKHMNIKKFSILLLFFVICVIFILELNYWNLLGFRF